MEALFDSVNDYLPAFFQIMVIGAGISVAMVIVRYMINHIVDELSKSDEREKRKAKEHAELDLDTGALMESTERHIADFLSLQTPNWMRRAGSNLTHAYLDTVAPTEKPKRTIPTPDGVEMEVIKPED